MKYLDIAIANESINTIDIKGREYSEVNQRIKAFRMVYPQGTIETEILETQTERILDSETNIVIFKATVKTEDGHILGTGTAYEKENSSFINKTSYIENCETSAVGRALGMAGFGIDVSVASAEEVQNAINNQEPTQEEADNYVLPFGKYKGKKINEVPTDYIEWMLGNKTDERLKKLIALATGIVEPTPEEQSEILDSITEILRLCDEKDVDIEEVEKKFDVDSISKMTLEQMRKCIAALKKKEI